MDLMFDLLVTIIAIVSIIIFGTLSTEDNLHWKSLFVATACASITMIMVGI